MHILTIIVELEVIKTLNNCIYIYSNNHCMKISLFLEGARGLSLELLLDSSVHTTGDTVPDKRVDERYIHSRLAPCPNMQSTGQWQC